MKGKHIPDWSGRRAQRALEQVKRHGYQNNTPCCLCDQPINYTLPSTDPNGCTVQHVKPRSLFPHLTWDPTNWAPAHWLCNNHQKNKLDLGLGTTSRDWG